MRKIANVNKQYSGIYMLLNTINLSVMVRQWNSIITLKNANLKPNVAPKIATIY